MRERARPRRQHRHRVEHAAEVGERREHEGRDPVHLVEILGEHRVDEATERKHQRREQHRTDRQRQVLHRQAREDQRDHRHHAADHQPAQQPAGRVAGDDDPVGQG